jgi:hypothetical protein
MSRFVSDRRPLLILGVIIIHKDDGYILICHDQAVQFLIPSRRVLRPSNTPENRISFPKGQPGESHDRNT